MLKLHVISILVLAYGMTKARTTKDCQGAWLGPESVRGPYVPGIAYLENGIKVCNHAESSCYYYRYSELEALYGGLFNESVRSITVRSIKQRLGVVDGDLCCKTMSSLLTFMNNAVHQTNVFNEGCQIVAFPPWYNTRFRFQQTHVGACHSPDSACNGTGYCTLSQIQRIVYLLAWCPSHWFGFYPFGFDSHCVCVNPGRGK